MSARTSAAAGGTLLLALLLASAADAGPLRKALRFAVRQAVGLVEARRTLEVARTWTERLRELPSSTPAGWPTVHLGGRSTAPAPVSSRPRSAPDHRPRGPLR